MSISFWPWWNFQNIFLCRKGEAGHTGFLIKVICTEIFKRMKFLNEIKSRKWYYLEIPFTFTMKLKESVSSGHCITPSISRWASNNQPYTSGFAADIQRTKETQKTLPRKCSTSLWHATNENFGEAKKIGTKNGFQRFGHFNVMTSGWF